MIIIHPWAQKLRNNNMNAKNYPYWNELITLIPDQIIQIGIEGEEQLVPIFKKKLSILELVSLIDECDAWISIDSFFQHLAWAHNKPGVVIFGKSDPNIFGHKENINLLKDRLYLREHQFDIWEAEEYNKNVFVKPEVVIESLNKLR